MGHHESIIGTRLSVVVWSVLPWGKGAYLRLPSRSRAPGRLPGSLWAALPALHNQFPSPACLSARCAVSPPAHLGLWLPHYLFVGALVWLSEMCPSGSSGIQHAAACLMHSPDLGSSSESIHIVSYFWNKGIYCAVPL